MAAVPLGEAAAADARVAAGQARGQVVIMADRDLYREVISDYGSLTD